MLVKKLIIGLVTGVIIVAGMLFCMRVLHFSLFVSGLLALAVGTLLVWLITIVKGQRQ
jgi:hypothetical protein